MTTEQGKSIPTLEQILTQYPIREYRFEQPIKGVAGKVINTPFTSQASINPDDGLILYVVPGSTRVIEELSKPHFTKEISV